MHGRFVIIGTFAIGLLVISGCGLQDPEQALPATLEEIDRVRDNDDLTPQEKRNALAALGISETTINALLRDEREANQFGGTVVTAYEKVINEQLNDLTPDEVQIYGDAAGDVDSNITVNFSDAVAQDIVDLFRDNAIASPEDLEALLSDPAAELPEDVEADDLQALFIDFDPDDLIDIFP